MFIDKIKPKDKNGNINVIIEIPMNDNPVKYEIDKESGAIFVDRFIPTPMFYPCNYGFVPGTLSKDGDPIDVLVISNYPVVTMSVITSRPIGVLVMEDESGVDEKIIAVPSLKVDGYFENLTNITDVNSLLLEKIKHFFEHYKDLEKNKWVKVQSYESAQIAQKLIDEAITRARA